MYQTQSLDHTCLFFRVKESSRLWFSVESGGRWASSETIPGGRWPELQSLLGGLKYIRVPARRCLFTTHWALPLHLSVVTQEEVPRLSGLRGEAAFIQQRKGWVSSSVRWPLHLSPDIFWEMSVKSETPHVCIMEFPAGIKTDFYSVYCNLSVNL